MYINLNTSIQFLANVVYAIARPSCRLSVITFVHPAQALKFKAMFLY